MMEERVELFYPNSKKEHALAQAMESFSSFVLKDNKDACLEILRNKKYSQQVGELQGGNDDYSIYRVVITNNPKDAISQLLNLFHDSTCRNNNNIGENLTKESLQEYMLEMCKNYSEAFEELANVMLVFSFGATQGQIRHIDHTNPNTMVCLYMSQDCPSTIIYSSSHGSRISCCEELLDYWQDNEDPLLVVPDLVKDIFVEQEHADLSHSHFAFWKTLHYQLQHFGKLYLPQDVVSVYEQAIEPGTTLIAGGNAVHAGPPTNGPRMFAYAIGVYDGEQDDIDDKGGKLNDGEVQYSPALLHLDLCCLVFDWMEQEYPHRSHEHLETKQFMIRVLIKMIQDMQRQHGNETYVRLLSDDRSKAREWIGRVVQAGANTDFDTSDDLETLIEHATNESTGIFAIPGSVAKPACTKREQRGRKKQLKRERRLKAK